MATLKLVNISKNYHNNVLAVNDFNLEVKNGEFVIFVGPSGCGKSTILRMIAGLEEISQGEIFIDDLKANNLAPKDRDIAMVFQNYALYPHMNVYENMAFGLKIRKMPKAAIAEAVKKVAAILNLEELLLRKPHQLSGGQRQRVALGRAIIRNPKIFLFDEPLSNLDAKLRAQMRSEILMLYQRLQATIIYVTHDQLEAMTMGSKIVVIDHGVIQQVGSPLELYNAPANIFVATFLGTPPMNMLKVNLKKEQAKLTAYSSTAFAIELPAHRLEAIGDRSEIFLGVRPEDFKITAQADGASFEAKITLIEQLGAETQITLSVDLQKIIIKTAASQNYHVGENLLISINSEKMHFFDCDSEQSLGQSKKV